MTIRCTPASGSLFSVGAATVTCIGTDARQQTGTCAFAVTVALTPRISTTNFLAIGNSITEGKLGDGSGNITTNNYPNLLQAMLAARYRTQTIVVINRGLGGERAIQGLARLPNELDNIRPDVLLIEEGVNDLSDDPHDISAMVDALADMIQEARGRGIPVFVATLLPERPGGSKALSIPWITEANERIRQMAAYEGARLVDLYQGFGGSPDPYIDLDGLHPNEAGYQKIAQLFFDVIRANLEAPQRVGPPIEFVRAETLTRFR